MKIIYIYDITKDSWILKAQIPCDNKSSEFIRDEIVKPIVDEIIKIAANEKRSVEFVDKL